MRRRQPLSRAARLTKEWISFYTADEFTFLPESVVLGSGAGASFGAWILDPASALELFDEPTVLRTRIQVTPAFAAQPAVNSQTLFCGVIVADRSAAFQPDAMNPMDFGSDDWLWWSTWSNVAGPALGSTGSTGVTQQDQWDDVKTKRRIEAGQGLLFVATQWSTSSANVTFVMTGRMLLGH